MKPSKILKLIAIISYLIIILSGEMIATPFFLWLIFSAIAGLTQEKLMALGAIIAVTVSFITIGMQRSIKMLVLDVLCFLLMLAPIVGRFILVPLHLFYYWCFLLPFSIFVVGFIIAIYLSLKEYIRLNKAA